MSEISKKPQADNEKVLACSAEFIWWGKHKDLIIVPDQPAIAVHADHDGNAVIRQRDTLGDAEQVIFITPEFAQKVANAILEAAGVVQQPATNLAKVGVAANEKTQVQGWWPEVH